MASELLTASSTLLCPHGATATHVAGQARVKAGGQPVLTVADTGTVTGCSYQLSGGAASPCVTVQWLVPATRVRAGAQPPLLKSSVALCKAASQAPQGPPTIVLAQPRVKGI